MRMTQRIEELLKKDVNYHITDRGLELKKNNGSSELIISIKGLQPDETAVVSEPTEPVEEQKKRGRKPNSEKELAQ